MNLMVDDRIICILTVVVNSVYKIHVFTFDCVDEMVKATGSSGGSTFLKMTLSYLAVYGLNVRK